MNNQITLLYVEDDDATRALVTIFLKKHKRIEATFARDGTEALGFYANSQYDIVITDMQMPHMDGFELIEKIHATNPAQTVVMASGMDDKEDFIKALNLDISYFLPKPLHATHFHPLVQKLIRAVEDKREATLNATLLDQYKHAVDMTSILSKTDSRGKITFVNQKFCEISGYSKEELLGKTHNILRHPDMPKALFKALWETIKAKKIWRGKVKNKKKDGRSYTVDATIIPILDSHGTIMEYVALRHDITELEDYQMVLKGELENTNKSLEERVNYIKQSEEAINISMAILKTDASNVITYANDSFCSLSGYTLEELIGANCRTLRHPKHIENGDCETIQARLKHNDYFKIIFTNVAKDGTFYYVDTAVYPLVNLNGKVTEHLHLMHDISELTALHQEIQSTQKEVVYKMGEIGESRSKETGNHVKRVAEYSKLLAHLVGLSEEECEILFTASPMHDIGKVAIADSVLNKPGKLTPEEFEVMKNHTTIGYDVLQGSSKYVLQAAATVAHEHHEKWDGSGYPRGLKGEAIHIYGRITAIADVFDALGHDRVYKKAWELERILTLFKEERGKHFDPRLIDLFFANLDRFLEIKTKFGEA